MKLVFVDKMFMFHLSIINGLYLQTKVSQTKKVPNVVCPMRADFILTKVQAIVTRSNL